jgi:ribonuclease T2
MKALSKLALLALLLAASVPASVAMAQEQCRLPSRITVAPCPNQAREEARGTKGDFDHYILSFSWSPAFCAGPAGRRATLQCRDNRFGWIIHGLWPQYAQPRAGQRWPQYCAAVAPVSEAVLRRHLCSAPDPRLMQCEWAKHGSCSDFATPAEYFAAQAAVATRLTLPEPQPGQSVQAFTAAVVSANDASHGHDRLERRHLRVIGGPDGIRELRICLERDLVRYRAC